MLENLSALPGSRSGNGEEMEISVLEGHAVVIRRQEPPPVQVH